MDRAVRAAHRAFTEGPWAATTPVERGRILKTIAAVLPEHTERLARLEVSDAGKIFTESTGFQKFCANFFMFYGELADKAVGHTFSVPFPGIQSYTHRVPMGVVAAVIPWNNPLWLLSLKLGPALAAGNTIVIKTSELCSAPLLEFMKIVEEVVDIPPGVVNFVTGTGEPCGRTLTSHPLVSKIAFTGGPATARRIVANSVDNLAEISLELGGKSPALVFPDADLDNAVASLMAGVFLGSAGQSCVASSRAIVHEDIFDEFLGRFGAAASAIRIGDPMSTGTQMGPLATEAQRERIQVAVNEAVASGAELLVGGKAPDEPERGWFFEPTVLLCRDHSLPIVDTELFGPVITVTPFSTEAQAIALANDTKYGSRLASSPATSEPRCGSPARSAPASSTSTATGSALRWRASAGSETAARARGRARRHLRVHQARQRVDQHGGVRRRRGRPRCGRLADRGPPESASACASRPGCVRPGGRGWRSGSGRSRPGAGPRRSS